MKAILLTHSHVDHVSGVKGFPGVPVYGLAAEQPFLDGTAVPMSFLSLIRFPPIFDSGLQCCFTLLHIYWLHSFFSEFVLFFLLDRCSIDECGEGG